MNTAMNTRNAAPADLSAIENLLQSAKLPLAGVREHLRNFIVLQNGEKLIGVVGLEVYGDKALLRSLAVAKEYQREGHGRFLYQAILEKARQQKIAELYLLTETAETFFAKQGFALIARESVDHKVKASIEFQSACPESAACMRLQLQATGSLSFTNCR
jgi:amino-acid N-acetyltransferase